MGIAMQNNYLGLKRYELSNHLGNVNQVISDRRVYVELEEEGNPVLEVQQRNLLNNWDASGTGSIVQSTAQSQQFSFTNGGDRVESSFATAIGKIYTLSFDAVSNTVDDLYVSIVEQNGGTFNQKFSVIGYESKTIEYSATSNEVSIAFIKLGANSSSSQTVNIENFKLVESIGDELQADALSGLGDWSAYNLDLSIEGGMLKASGQLEGYIERTLPTVPGNAYVLKLNSTFVVSGLNSNTQKQILTQVEVPSTGEAYKKAYLNSGQTEFYFVARESTTTLHLETWTDVNEPLGSPAGFMLDKFEVREVVDVGSSIALSIQAGDWTATAGATVSNNPTNNQLVIDYTSKDAKASLAIPQGILKVKMNHTNSGTNPEFTVVGNGTYEVIVGNAAPSDNYSIDNYGASQTFDLVYEKEGTAQAEVYSLEYIPQTIGSILLSEDYELPSMSTLNNGTYIASNGAVLVSSEKENDGIQLDVKGSTEKAYKISFNVDAKTTDFQVLYRDKASGNLVDTRTVNSTGAVEFYVEALKGIDNQIEFVGSEKGNFQFSGLSIEEVNSIPANYNNLATSSNWQIVEGYVKDNALYLDGELGQTAVTYKFATTPR